MKTIGGMLVACIVIIAYNLMVGANAASTEQYSPVYAERVATFGIIAVPLLIIFLFLLVGRLFERKDRK